MGYLERFNLLFVHLLQTALFKSLARDYLIRTMERKSAFAPPAVAAFLYSPCGSVAARRRDRRNPLPLQRRIRVRSCASSPQDTASSAPSKQLAPLLPSETINSVLDGTMLASDTLALAYTSTRDGFDNESFFDCLMPLGGVPSLVLGRTVSGSLFGGYAASGFLARDDYREATNPRSLFVFRITEANELLFAESTDLVQYDFYDYAVRLGAALLGVPMNPRKHIMKADMGTSSCRLSNGETSVFGDATLAKIEELQVWVAQKYMDELDGQKPEKRGFFARLFG